MIYKIESIVFHIKAEIYVQKKRFDICSKHVPDKIFVKKPVKGPDKQIQPPKYPTKWFGKKCQNSVQEMFRKMFSGF